MKIVESHQHIAQNTPDCICVGMDEYLISESDMMTYGIANCVGLVAHNAETKRGLVGHFIVGTALIAEAIPAISEIGHYAGTSIWVGGTSISTDSSMGKFLKPLNIDSIEERQFVIGEIRKLFEAGFSEDSFTIDWGQVDKTTEFRLYTAEAKLLVNKWA